MNPVTRVAFFVDNHEYIKSGCNNFWDDLPGNHDAANRACELLEKIGFKCDIPRQNATAKEFRQLPGLIAGRLRNTHGALCLVGFSGHGMMYKGRLYLIPADHAEALQGTAGWFSAGMFVLGSLASLFVLAWLPPEPGLLMPSTAFYIICIVFFWRMMIGVWRSAMWHPLSNAYCVDHLETKLANIHETHAAWYATFVLLLDCCRDYRRLSWWHRLLLRLHFLEKTVDIKMSHKSSRPNFFKIFACEEGRVALGSPSSYSYLTQALLTTLELLKHGCTLDQLLTSIDGNFRGSCNLGLQKLCMYSTSYRLAKQIIIWDRPADTVSNVGPTLLTSMRKNQLSLKPSEQRLFQRHRHSSDPQTRKEILSIPALSHDLRAMLLLRALAEKRPASGRI